MRTQAMQVRRAWQIGLTWLVAGLVIGAFDELFVVFVGLLVLIQHALVLLLCVDASFAKLRIGLLGLVVAFEDLAQIHGCDLGLCLNRGAEGGGEQTRDQHRGPPAFCRKGGECHHNLILSAESDAELKTAGATVVFIVGDGNAVVQTQRPKPGNIEADAKTDIVVVEALITVQSKAVGILINITDVIEDSKAQSLKRGHNGQAVFEGSKPHGLAADWLA